MPAVTSDLRYLKFGKEASNGGWKTDATDSRMVDNQQEVTSEAMYTSEELKQKLRTVVEELWAEHRATKAEAGKELPAIGSNATDDQGCGCKACISAGQMLNEAGG